MNEDDKLEFIGQIIDIFEDNLEERKTDNKQQSANVKLVQLDDESDGVFFGGMQYDRISEQLKKLFANWNLNI